MNFINHNMNKIIKLIKIVVYVYDENNIYIEEDDYFHPDVILHELGHHFLRVFLGKCSYEGNHSFGELLTSRMSIYGACKLSWNEDIANYFSDNIVTITGVYKYNPRFKIVI